MSNAEKFELNEGDNIQVLVDVSGSMDETDCPNGLSRIEYSKEKTIALAREASKYDTNGIHVVKFGHAVNVFKNVTADKAADIIGNLKADETATFTHDAIAKAFQLHKEDKSEQTVCLVITDGAPSKPDEVLKTIAGITEQIKDETEFCLCFLTVGKRDAKLNEFLKRLDGDDKPIGKFDIVEVRELESTDFMQAFAGALKG